jgi:hypothetical protein
MLSKLSEYQTIFYRDSTIEQQVGYMPNDFQMEIKIKMNAVVSNGGNIIHVTEIKIRNCTDQPNNSSIGNYLYYVIMEAAKAFKYKNEYA